MPITIEEENPHQRAAKVDPQGFRLHLSVCLCEDAILSMMIGSLEFGGCTKRKTVRRHLRWDQRVGFLCNIDAMNWIKDGVALSYRDTELKSTSVRSPGGTCKGLVDRLTVPNSGGNALMHSGIDHGQFTASDLRREFRSNQKGK
jgi:hypothetical protein